MKIHYGNRETGIALIFTLCMVVLVTLLALAFFAAVTLERQSSSAYANSSNVRMLADSAVNLVMGQIRQASEQTNVAWTSQPGLLRTFDAAGQPLKVYKLYSASEASLPAAAFNPTNDVPADWRDRPAEYVDLNRPKVSRINGQSFTNYPILNPNGIGKIEGFTTNTADGVAMPVAWRYILEDGTITNSTGMSKTNPPIARIAYWTDDETCKLNVNTASEGFFWDMPRASGSAKEWDMALKQPVQGEYQGYPGHPATTSLSPVLWSYFKQKSPDMVRDPVPNNTNTFPEVLYSMLPRISPGGSKGGTVSLQNITQALPAKTNRLFASVDEMAFLSTRLNGVRQRNPYFDQDVMEQTRFFLTTQSRAPELTLAGLPRITAWPIHGQTDDLHRTPFDRLIAFASTINGKPYYFTRSNPNSPTADFSGRNLQLYEYLQRLTGEEVSGFGGNFADKYGVDRDQILTEIFDYIRCINLQDTSTSDPNFVPFTPRGTIAAVADGIYSAGTLIPALGTGQVVPTIPPSAGPGGGTKGFGRFQTLNRVILVLSSAEEDTVEKHSQMQAALFFETFDPSLAPAAIRPNFTIRLTPEEDFEVISDEDASAAKGIFNFSGDDKVDSAVARTGGSDRGGYNGFAANSALSGNYAYKTALSGTQPYRFVTSPFKVDWNSVAGDGSNNSTIKVKGGRFKADVVGPTGEILQTFTIGFDDFETQMPRPIWPTYGNWRDLIHADGTVGGVPQKYRSLDQRVTLSRLQVVVVNAGRLRMNFTGHWISEADVARSLEVTGSGAEGDLRLLAAKQEAAGFFEPVSGYGNTGQREYSALTSVNPERLMAGSYYVEASGYDNKRFGSLVQNSVADGNGTNSPYNNLARFRGTSFVPIGINGVTNVNGSPGDWDTGMGAFANGPYINRSDDGDIFTTIAGGSIRPPYYALSRTGTPPGATFSSPSRQMPSAVMFGSLSTGVNASPPRPWQTLLFCPNPSSRYGAGAAAHPGEAAPKDHLLLDLFQIPVVEPYAISEPFSTAGKVNLNYQIIPFTGIERKTAMHGVLRAVKITAINDTLNAKWSSAYGLPPDTAPVYRYSIDIERTLREGVDNRFSGPTPVFKSASEICDVPLIPLSATNNPVTFTSLDQFWTANNLTGDNLRENPYTRLYPRLTTRSNTYTVHVWVETLKKIPGTSPDEWVEGKDLVTGQFRGSFLIERYLNPADAIPDYATSSSAESLNAFYRFRVITARQFNP